MKKDEIKSFFPKTFTLTQELIDNEKSIGEALLKSYLPQELWEDTFWGLSIGTIDGVKIKTECTVEYQGKKVKVPLYLDKSLKAPIEVTFELR